MKKMKNLTLSAVFIFQLLLTGCYSTSGIISRPLPNLDRDKRLNIAIVDFKNISAEAENNAYISAVSSDLLSELQKTKTFRLIERQKMESVLSELKLSMSGLVDPANAKQLGRQLGVDALLFGDISAVKLTPNKQTIVLFYREGFKTEVTLNAKLVSVETGEILASTKVATYVNSSKWVAFRVATIGTIVSKGVSISNCLELGAKQIAIDLANQME